MQVARTIGEMRSATAGLRGNGRTLALVPTMGAIHAGHLSLVAAGRAECECVAASLFVNPLQFGPSEDFARYPRSFDEDCRLLERAGVDLLFAPEAAEMYPPGPATTVEVAEIGDRLDGRSRPGHFRGVATVVAKLLHIVQPQVACFGQKDAAQLAVLRAMVRGLNLPVRLVGCPIVRDPDGLAMSSRNRYLSATERVQALALRRALVAAESCAAQGETASEVLRAAMLEVLGEEPGVRLDYAEIVDPDTLAPVQVLQPVAQAGAGTLAAVAAWVGSTRLIDNTLLPGSPAHG